MLDFMEPLDEEQLWDQIFNLKLVSQGTGLGMGMAEIMELDVNQKDELLRRLYEHIEDMNNKTKNNGGG